MNIKEGVVKIYNSPSRSFLFYCGSFILGAAVFSLSEARGDKIYFLFAGVLLTLFLLSFLFKNRAGLFGAIILLLFCLGALRAVAVLPSGSADEVASIIGKQITLEGRVADVEKPGQYIFTAKNYSGKILVNYNLYPVYHYGDNWRLNCELEAPAPFEDFRYDKYLLNKGVYAICKFPNIISVPGFTGSNLKRAILALKNIIGARVNLLWTEPESGLMAGLLYGEKSALPADLLNNFNRVGLTHIIAVSGYNTSVIVIAVLAGLIFVGFWRRQALWLSGLILFAFVIFTGATASVVRAALLACIGMTAQLLGRPARSLNGLVFAASLMVLFHPLIIWYDAGFQLSFLAVIGVMYLGPKLAEFFKLENDENVLITTMGAIIMTLPLLAYQFGRVSLVAPLSNLLILWIIPFLMLAGFIAVIIGLIFLPAGQMLAFVAHLGLKYVIITVNYLGGLTFASREISLPLYLVILSYILIFWFLIFYGKKSKNSSIRHGL